MVGPNYDPRIKEFLSRYPEGKIPSLEAQAWFQENKGVPPRTFQHYMEEDLVPKPSISEGRNNFYATEEFVLLVDTVDVIRALKTSTKIRFKSLRKIFNKYELRKVVDKLLNLIENYPIYEQDHTEPNPLYRGQDFYRQDHDFVWCRVIEELEKGSGKLESIKFAQLEEEYTDHKAERLKKK